MAGTILVAGATGGVGRQVVSKLVTQEQAVRVLVRKAAKARELFCAGEEIVVGDTRQPATLEPALAGVRAVICATGTRTPTGHNSPQHVDFEGVRNLAQAAAAVGVEWFVLVSTISATRLNNPLNAFGKVLSWKLAGENAVRESGVPYTIIRPGGLTDQPGAKRALQIAQGDRIMGMVSRADVAELCIRALDNPDACNVTFEVIETQGQPVSDWSALFKGLQPDPVKA
jgi:uncharacterized protein YbjT (DUF2867 family)